MVPKKIISVSNARSGISNCAIWNCELESLLAIRAAKDQPCKFGIELFRDKNEEEQFNFELRAALERPAAPEQPGGLRILGLAERPGL
jgi:hypothetical protein